MIDVLYLSVVDSWLETCVARGFARDRNGIQVKLLPLFLPFPRDSLGVWEVLMSEVDILLMKTERLIKEELRK